MKSTNQKIKYRQPIQQIFLWVALCTIVTSVAFFGLSNQQVNAALPLESSEVMTGVCDLQKQGFTLINAATDEDIQRINNGDVITLSKDMLSRLSIRVDADGDAGSAALKLNNDYEKVENYLPFTLFGDSGVRKNGSVDYGRGTIAAGDHTLVATAYSKDNGHGDVCDSLSVNFTIQVGSGMIEEPTDYQPIACDVVDAEAYWNKNDIHTIWFRDGAVHWRAESGARYIENDDGTARLYGTITKDGQDRNFDFMMAGRTFNPPPGSPKLETHYEIDDTNGWYYYTETKGTIGGEDYIGFGPGFQVGIGANMKQPEAFGAAAWLAMASNPSAHGGDINIRLINCRPREQAPQPTPEPAACTLQKDGFVLVDAQTDQDIWKIQDGETIYVDNRKLSLLNIRTNASGEAGSVVMELDDDVVKIERKAPYALFGDNSGDYAGGIIANGYHELTATAYPNSDGTGEACDSLTVRFTIEVAESPTPDTYVPQTCDVIDGVNFNNGVVSTIWLKGGYTWSGQGVQFVEAADGTARLFGTVTRDGEEMDFDFQLSDRTFTAPEGSPKAETYYEINDTSGWYYYPNWGGVLDGVEYVRKGPSFQVGVGANMRQAETYGASGWFAFADDPTQHAGDVNIRLVNCRPTDIPHEVASLGNQVWLDANENGIQDDGEVGVPGITVNLLGKDSDEPLATRTTNANGRYVFRDLDPKLSYRVQFVIPDDLLYLFTESNQGDNDNVDSDVDTTTGITKDFITLESGEDRRDVDAGLINAPHEAASLGDRVWMDEDGDGVQDEGEPSVGGVTVNLLRKDSDEPIISMVTDSDGSYLFTDLDPKMSYRVQFVIPDNWPLIFTEPNQTGDEAQDSDVDPTTGITKDFITLEPGEDRRDVDAGIMDEPHQPASLGDVVWLDANENGIQDEGETPVSGITVNLLSKDSTTPLASMTTGADGMYLFDELDPKQSYRVQFVIPDDMRLLFTDPNQGDDDNVDSDPDPTTGITEDLTLESGEDRRDVDAGLINEPHETASIGDRVWKDDNENGIQDEGEPGVGGITVNLLSKDSDTPLASVETESDGSYVFTELDPKESYRVQFVIPEEWKLLFTTSTQGNDPEMDSDVDPTTGITKDFITVDPGENRMDVDAGVQNEPAAIGDFVWLDQNINDIQDAGEPGIADVIVRLWTDTDGDSLPDLILEESTTDADGKYRFENLNAKMIYFVEFETPGPGPNTYFPIKPGSDPTVDLDPALDSDFDPFTGFTAPIIFDFGEENLDIDGGFAVPPSDDNTPVPTDEPAATDTPMPTDEPAATDTPMPDATETPVATDTPDMGTPSEETATYNVTFDALWSADSSHPHPDGTDAFPSNAHFSPLIGAVHSGDVTLWEAGGMATTGIENMAETGSTTALEGEVQAAIDANLALSVINGPEVSPSPGSATISDIMVTTDNPLVTLVTMIAPSPDWFLGVSNLSMIENGEWADEIVVELRAYDAGTEEGTAFSINNDATDPQEEISRLSDHILGRFTFTRVTDTATATPVPGDTDTPVPTDTPMPVDTDTPVPADTDTPVPTDTPMPVDTDTPVPTDTPMPVDTDTPVPTETPVPVDTDTPTPVPTDTPAAGPEGTTIMVGTNTVASGDDIMIILEGFLLDGLGTATIEVTYDPAILEVVNCSKDPTGQFDLVQCNAQFSENTIRFNITSLTGVSGDVTIAEITFRALGQNGDESAIGLSAATFANSQGNNSPVTFIDGKVIVSDARAGDVNCDGSRNAVDAMFTLQHDVGMREGSPTCTQPQRNKSILYTPNCDVSGDAQCNPIDALFSLQCAVGLPNRSCPGDDGTRTVEDEGAPKQAVKLSVDTIPAGTSGAIAVPVMIEGADNLGSFGIEVFYEPSKLRIIDCQINEELGGLGLCNKEFSKNSVRFSSAVAEGISGNVQVAIVTFETIGTLESEVFPRLSADVMADGTGNAVPFEIAEANQPAVTSLLNWLNFLPLIQK